MTYAFLRPQPATRPKPFYSERIIDEACRVFHVARHDVLGNARFVEYVQPRFAIYYAMRQQGLAYETIARRIGRDRHSVRNGCRRAEVFAHSTPGYAEALALVVAAA